MLSNENVRSFGINPTDKTINPGFRTLAERYTRTVFSGIGYFWLSKCMIFVAKEMK